MQSCALCSAQTTVSRGKGLFILWKELYAAAELVFITPRSSVRTRPGFWHYYADSDDVAELSERESSEHFQLTVYSKITKTSAIVFGSESVPKVQNPGRPRLGLLSASPWNSLMTLVSSVGVLVSPGVIAIFGNGELDFSRAVALSILISRPCTK